MTTGEYCEALLSVLDECAATSDVMRLTRIADRFCLAALRAPEDARREARRHLVSLAAGYRVLAIQARQRGAVGTALTYEAASDREAGKIRG